ncbi:MAG: hypothetical protein CMJ46_02040 [Planctomyces sp.]|nr:hypothetical protein [Planctomyces sp.]
MLIDNTLSCAAASGKNWDAVIVGAGPAGALAAHQLAKQGFEVLLVDRKRFPRPKVCGGCVNDRSLSLLKEAGLGDMIAREDAIPLSQMEIHSRRQNVALPLPGGIAISRTRFDELLLERAQQRGVSFLSGVTAQLDDLSDAGTERLVNLQKPDQKSFPVRAQLVILADGLANSALKKYPEAKSRSVVASRVGLGGTITHSGEDYRAGCIYMAVSDKGYVGLTRFAGGWLNIASALDARALKDAESTSALIREIIAGAKLPSIKGLDEVEWSGTIPLTRSPQRMAMPRVLLCGDAAGYVEPFTGEGIASALQGGYLAADFVGAHLAHWNESAEQQWTRLYRARIQNRYRYCRWITRISRSPRAVEWALSTVRRFPAITRPVIRHLNEPLDIAPLPG